MSGFGFSPISQILDAGGPGIMSVVRSIGGITPDVTVEEVGDDELAITQHPVEKTADITDHAYPLPARLQVRIAFSPSGSGVGGVSPDLGDSTPMQTIYDQFRAMKDDRELLEVQTGKRKYKNMLIRTISLINDRDTENGLFLTLNLQEILLAETQTTVVPQNDKQALPQKTANSQDAGTKQAKPNPPTFNNANNDLVQGF